MDADGVVNGHRAATAVADMRVKVLNATQAIAFETQAIGAHAHAILAYVEGILESPSWIR